ncbi:MAG: RtcB family protein [Syntrophobacteraceae bacterium]
MKKVITTEKVPIKLWLDDIEDGALEQAINLANLPFTFRHVAIMPDAHQGYGMPIGGVLAARGVIIPNAVGVDIGCGMCALKTSMAQVGPPNLKRIMSAIRTEIPLGFEHNKTAQPESLMPEFKAGKYIVIPEQYKSALKQIGTLGGGNHFIEIQSGSDGHVWIMIHSGSRNLGKQVADHYNKLAVALNEKWSAAVPKKWQLAFLPIDSEEGRSYIREMNYCVAFALANRKLMMEKIKGIVGSLIGCEFYEMINIAHNYAAMENHFGESVVVHRKGATLASEETVGIIPGSQGTKSYIVRGKGNPESFHSCSHGAGRLMGRKEAERRLSLEKEIKKLDDQGILHAIRGKHDLDEASGAYKPIDVVMRNQEDLVEITHELQPLAVIKG